MSAHDEARIRRCVALALEAQAAGDHPFGALLEVDGVVVLECRNTVSTSRDASAHAELNVVRGAQAALPVGTKLADATMYTSTEPCMMCCGAIYWAGIGRVVYGCSDKQLAAVAGGDFLVPCRQSFAHGQRPVEVVGPVLGDECARAHADYWPNL
jgi:tRNA(Arg) A34 adenosine deaminase TadA